MVRRAVLIVVVAGCMLSATVSAWAGSTNVEQVKGIAHAFLQAQFSFDHASIQRLTAPGFVEISPKGEVDEREAVLGFYLPHKKTPAPPYSIRDQKVRLTGKFAVITQTVDIGTPPRTMRLSQSLTAVRVGRQWKLTSSQSTPMAGR